MWGIHLNPSVRWVQLLLLVVLTAFIGAMWGLERSVVPLIAQSEFGISSATVALSFIIGFGLAKTFANLFAGGLMDQVGRRRVLLLGWAIGAPAPLIVIWAPVWEWVILANLLLGVNQGLCWTATILMMMDIMGAKRRGLATGLNEFVGYSGVAISALASGFIAVAFAPRPYIFLIGIGLAILGLLLSLAFVRETNHFPREEAAKNFNGYGAPSFWKAFFASLRDRTLVSCSQGGLVTKINDATVWGLFPLFLASRGLDAVSIGIIAALYPAVWGVFQLWTGFLSDHLGRKPLIVGGMLVQALGMWLAAVSGSFPLWIGAAALLGLGTALVYPTLIAAIGDNSHPERRASAIGIYRWYRDGGFVVGAFLAGLLADALGFSSAIMVIGTISLFSSLTVGALMVEPSIKVSPAEGSLDSI